MVVVVVVGGGRRSVGDSVRDGDGGKKSKEEQGRKGNRSRLRRWWCL